MQTHEDRSHEFMNRLRDRAEQAKGRGDGSIAAGQPNEFPHCAYEATNKVHVRIMPDDPQGILRISIGGGEHLPVTMNYCTIRGDVGQCIALLEKALVALKECP
jgi:hypothetical protein